MKILLFIATLTFFIIQNVVANTKSPYQNLQGYDDEKSRVYNTKEIVIADISSYTYLGKQNIYDKKSSDVYNTINSVSATGVEIDGYFNGRNLAISKINSNGGILGKKIKIITIDDRGDPIFAERSAEKVINEQGAVAILGGNITKNAIGIAKIAEKKKVFYITSGDYSDTTAWLMNTKYTYRLRPSAYVTGTAWGVTAAKQNINNWTIIIPGDSFGKELADAFEVALKKSNKNVVINKKVVPQFYDVGKDFFTDLSKNNSEGFFLAVYGADLVTILYQKSREQSWFFNNKKVLCLNCGVPEWNYYIKTKIPNGWIVGGYPAYFIKNNSHLSFYKEYVNRYKKAPTESALYGYTSVQIISYLVEQKLINKPNALNNKTLATPFGDITFREDHQSTIGIYIGETLTQKKNLFMIKPEYIDSRKILPPLSKTLEWRQNNSYKGIVTLP